MEQWFSSTLPVSLVLRVETGAQNLGAHRVEYQEIWEATIQLLDIDTHTDTHTNRSLHTHGGQTDRQTTNTHVDVRVSQLVLGLYRGKAARCQNKLNFGAPYRVTCDVQINWLYIYKWEKQKWQIDACWLKQWMLGLIPSGRLFNYRCWF